VSNGTQVSVANQADLYTSFELINEGEINFASTSIGGLYIDAGLDNSNGTLTLNDAILYLGGNTGRADGNHNLIFGSNDNAKFVELGKNNGTLNVTGGSLSITNTFTSNSGTLNAGDRVILKSTSIDNTALVPESTEGTINSIRVERLIPSERAYRFMSSPVTTDQFIFENWQQNGLNPSDPDYRDNVGTHVTGGTVADGFDQNQSGNPSMYSFDLQAQNYVPISNTKTTRLINSEGYYTLIRGDRGVNLFDNNATPTETTLEQTGSLYIGTKTNSYTLPSNEVFVLLGNPYQAPTDMNAVIGASDPSFKNQMWIWIQTDYTSGQFVNIDDLTNPITNVPGSNVTKDLQPGQAGFFQTKNGVSGDVSLTFNEADKVGSENLTETFSVKTNLVSSPDGFLRIGLYDVNSIPFVDVAYDGIIVKFDNQYSNTVDDYDGMKFFSAEESLSVLLNDTYLSSNNRKLPDNLDEVINLSFFNLDQSEYVFSVELEGLLFLPNGILLWDKYLDSYTPLTDQGLIHFNIDASLPGSSASDRFALVFEDATLEVEDHFFSEVNFYPNPIVGNFLNIQFSEALNGKKVEVEIYTINGILVRREVFDTPEQMLQLSHLNFSSGVYMLKLKEENKTKTFKIIKK
jgi:hypothetical protein